MCPFWVGFCIYSLMPKELSSSLYDTQFPSRGLSASVSVQLFLSLTHSWCTRSNIRPHCWHTGHCKWHHMCPQMKHFRNSGTLVLNSCMGQPPFISCRSLLLQKLKNSQFPKPWTTLFSHLQCSKSENCVVSSSIKNTPPIVPGRPFLFWRHHIPHLKILDETGWNIKLAALG